MPQRSSKAHERIQASYDRGIDFRSTTSRSFIAMDSMIMHVHQIVALHTPHETNRRRSIANPPINNRSTNGRVDAAYRPASAA
eukprot:6202929-Pleurochrysis_carterae.AAC.1